MASTAAALVTAIKTALARVNGAAPYNYDLTAASAVRYGVFSSAPSKSRSAFVAFFEDVLENVTEAIPLTYFGRRARYVFTGWVHAAKSSEARAVAAMDLRADILEALERGVYGKPGDTPVGGDISSISSQPVTMVEDGGVAIDGDTVNVPGWALCRIDVSFAWRERYGA